MGVHPQEVRKRVEVFAGSVLFWDEEDGAKQERDLRQGVGSAAGGMCGRGWDRYMIAICDCYM